MFYDLLLLHDYASFNLVWASDLSNQTQSCLPTVGLVAMKAEACGLVTDPCFLGGKKTKGKLNLGPVSLALHIQTPIYKYM